MSWIKDNKFAAILGGATLLGAIVLFYIGLIYHGRYAKALESYHVAADNVEVYEKTPLYPSLENRAGKTKALNEYRVAIRGLESAYDKFRPKQIKNIAPQSFTDHAKSAKEEVVKAFETVAAKLPDVPEGFLLGFEPYTKELAREEATGLLDYQLGATKELLLALAKAAPTQLQNLFRPKFPEEDGDKWLGSPTDAARSFPIELTFRGPERSLREFLSTIVKSPNYFFVVRTVRIMNEKPTAPNVKDAKFEAPPGAPGAAGKPADPFGGASGFVLPSDEPAAPAPPPPTPTTKPAATTPAKPAASGAVRPAAAVPARPPVVPLRPAVTAPPRVAPAAVVQPKPAAAVAADSSRILNRVLGNEELEVFLHIDVLEFLPVKALPEVPKSQP
ncbi:MAG: Amuc_1100 family pilus-like protein [Verrucomicrobiota bacterium]